MLMEYQDLEKYGKGKSECQLFVCFFPDKSIKRENPITKN